MQKEECRMKNGACIALMWQTSPPPQAHPATRLLAIISIPRIPVSLLTFTVAADKCVKPGVGQHVLLVGDSGRVPINLISSLCSRIWI